MLEIIGKENTAICYAKTIEETALQQIKAICDRSEFAESKIRIMPDVHAGAGCTIGTTMTIMDKAVPNMVGVDIGCGMETVQLKDRKIYFEDLDDVIRTRIPHGRNVRGVPHCDNSFIDLKQLYCFDSIDYERARCSIGTLGGGNHFIEVDRSEDGTLYLVIHSGSRHLGLEVASYYQQKAIQSVKKELDRAINCIITWLKSIGCPNMIEPIVKHARQTLIPDDMAYVSDELFERYIHDMNIVQYFASLNRKAMADTIVEEMGLHVVNSFTTIHNYIDTEAMILRKGAVSAKAGEKLLIPINMRDGSLICVGKGNPDWNYSAPHGAGRLMSRTAANSTLSVEKFQEEMKGIYTTCVSKKTLDESPMAYKSIDEIVETITPTVTILERIHPVYNFKASE